MDALSLLCTLHADGPATLQRLRSLGCRGLGAFLEMDADELARALGLEAAVARRLLREGRILAERLGSEALEAEEAAPVSTRPAARPEPAPAAPALDEGDAALVARILSDAPADPFAVEPAAVEEQPAAPEMAAPPTIEPEVAPAPEIAQPVAAEEPVAELPVEEAAEDVAEALEPISEPEAVHEEPVDEFEDVDEDVEEGPEPLAPDALTVGALPGLDAAMVEDLAAAGITTLGALGAADSLTLTRNLGVTFAQARRMRFLARRAADNLAAVGAVEPVPVELVEEAPAVEIAPEMDVAEEAPEEVPEAIAPEALPVPPSAPEQALEQTPEPTVEVLPAAPPVEAVEEPAPEIEAPAPAPAHEAVVAPERPPFWQPRPFHAADDAEEPQGVKVDPAEIEARPRFGDRLAKAAQDGQLRSESRPSGRTVLGWNFEIPRPAAEELPLASFGANGAGAPDPPEGPQPADDEAKVASDEGAGPFA